MNYKTMKTIRIDEDIIKELDKLKSEIDFIEGIDTYSNIIDALLKFYRRKKRN